MKKQFYLIFLLGGVIFNTQAQLPVSHDLEKKNVIMEEYTGINCGPCVDGHIMSNGLADDHPGDLFIVNIHTGFVSVPDGDQPDYRTEFGWPLASAAVVAGFPMASINRHIFEGFDEIATDGGHAMTRYNFGTGVFYWGDAVDIILEEDAYVNIAGESFIDYGTREMTVKVEAFFTGSGAPETMKLNVAVLQNNIVGPQLAGSYNPDQYNEEDSTYNHQHMLRHLITGQWGEEISETAEGTLIERTYTWTIPDHLNDIDFILDDLEVIVFLAEGNDEIINVANAKRTDLVGITEISKVENLTIYPNPSTDFVYYSGDAVVEQIEIFDVNGSLVEIINQPTSNKVYTGGYNQGMYLIRFTTTHGVLTKQLIVRNNLK